MNSIYRSTEAQNKGTSGSHLIQSLAQSLVNLDLVAQIYGVLNTSKNKVHSFFVQSAPALDSL